MRMRCRATIECKACCGPHYISWFGGAPPGTGTTYAYRCCPSKLRLQLIDPAKLRWDIAERYAGRIVIVGIYGPPEAELLEMDQPQPN